MPLTEHITHTFEHSWQDISLASWKKYPSDNRPDVLSVDLVDRHFDPETGLLTATRLVIMEDKLPKFLQPIFGNNQCICVEKSIVDPKNKRMVLHSQNISFEKIVTIKESCIYTQNPDNPECTDFVQTATVHAYPFGVAGNIERFLCNKFVRNAPLGREIMETTVQSVKEDNVFKTAIDLIKKETLDCANQFEQRFDSFKDDLTEKVKETEKELSEFYIECKKAGTEWTADRIEEIENFIDEKFDNIFIPSSGVLMEKQ